MAVKILSDRQDGSPEVQPTETVRVVDFALGDDIFAQFGPAYLGWETADPNANALVLALPVGGAVDVPVFVIGNAAVKNVDLTFFNGKTEPLVAVVDVDQDSWVGLGFNGNDDAQILIGGSAVLTLPALTLGGAIAGGDQALTGVGDMTFTDGSIIAAIDGAATSLIFKAGGLSGTTFITLNSVSGGTDNMVLGKAYFFDVGGEYIESDGSVLTIAGVVNHTGLTFIGDTANANMTLGLTINQGANDDEILNFKSSDVSHGMTDYKEADTYGFFSKGEDAAGGLSIGGLKSAAGNPFEALQLRGFLGEAAQTTKTTGSKGVINIAAYVISGSTVGALAAGGNILSVQDAATTVFILDKEGDLWLNGGITCTGTLYLFDVGGESISSNGSTMAFTGNESHSGDSIIADTKGILTGLAADDYFILSAYDSTGATRVGMEAIRIANNTAVTAKIGFFGTAPVAQPSAYTQTYATADKTHADLTVDADIGLFTDPPSAAEMALLRTFVNALKVDLTDVKQLTNSLIDDLQALGLVA